MVSPQILQESKTEGVWGFSSSWLEHISVDRVAIQQIRVLEQIWLVSRKHTCVTAKKVFTVNLILKSKKVIFHMQSQTF